MLISELMESNQPVMYVPIGPSGAGKTTYYKKLKKQNPNLQVFSLDILRHEFYNTPDYKIAWELASKDEEFGSKADKIFKRIIKSGVDVYLDNTNRTEKSRCFYIQQAKQKGYKIIAIVFDVDIDTLLSRQISRTDKTVPENVVRDQLKSIQYPVSGEVDEVVKA